MPHEKTAPKVAQTPEAVNDTPHPKPKLATLNQATIIGTETEVFNELLNQEVEIMTGLMFGAHNKRNTQDGDWKPVKATHADLIKGWPRQGDAPEFGFSRHTASKSKAGFCIVLGSSIGGARKAKAMQTMSFLGMDIDSGARLKDVVKTLVDEKIAYLVHTSYNHGKCGLSLPRDVVLRKLGIKTDPTLEQVQEFLRLHDKNMYEESFIQAVTIKTAKKQVKEGVVIVLDTPPLDKYRLFFPLAKPVNIIDLAETHQDALGDWENAVTGLARKGLGIHFDTSCTDPSRLFFTARHPRDSDNWESYIIQGEPLDYAKIPRMKKSDYTGNRDGNAFTMAGGGDDWKSKPHVMLDSGTDLTEWHSKVGKNRLMLADLIDTYCPDKIRQAGGEKAGHVHTECPFEHEHTTEGGTGTMAVNCIDAQNEYWTWFCKHDACQGRHKTELLGEAINRGWFDESLLTSDEFLLVPEDGEEDPLIEMREEAGESASADGTGEPKGPPSVEELINRIDFEGDGVEAAIRKLYKRLHKRDVDKVEQTRINKTIKDKSGLDLPTLKRFWADLDMEKHSKEAAQKKTDAMTSAGSTRMMVETKDSSDDMNIAAVAGLKELNREEPRLFHFTERLAVIRDDSAGRAKIEVLTRQGALSNIIHDLGIFHKEVGNGTKSKFVRAYPPKDTVSYVWELPKNIIGLPLRAVKTTPFFGRDGNLVHVNGYDPASRMVLAMPLDAELSTRVSGGWEPTDDEVDAAVMLLAEVVGDFALDSMSRAELDAALATGKDTPSFAVLMGVLIAGMAREMIDGPTPAYFLAKPTPGTGASLLTEIITTILLGAPAPSFGLPENKEELTKTLSTILFEAREVAFFDNINHSIDSGDFASMLTKRIHAARIMGTNQKTIEVEVLNLWILNGNNVTMSGELLRRSVPVFLDTGLADPAKGREFKVKNIQKHVEDRRWNLVSAVLTLIQNWIVQGCPAPDVPPIASYEEWTRVVGGVLQAAGIKGFLSKMDEWADAASDTTDDSLTRLMALLAEYPVGTVLRPSGTETPTDATTGQAETGKVVSVIDVLNAAGDPDNDVEPILLKGWSYKELFDDMTRKTRVVYSNAAQVSKRLRASARVPYAIGEGDAAQELHLAERKAKKNGARYWVRIAPKAKPEAESAG